jgi:hypothetical protein
VACTAPIFLLDRGHNGQVSVVMAPVTMDRNHVYKGQREPWLVGILSNEEHYKPYKFISCTGLSKFRSPDFLDNSSSLFGLFLK